LAVEALEARQLLSVTGHGSNGVPFVIPNVQVQNVYWGQAWSDPATLIFSPTAQERQLDRFMADIVNSPYLDMLGEYGVGRGSFVANHDVPPNGPANFRADGTTRTTVTEAQITNMLDTEIRAGRLDVPDASHLYFVFLPPIVHSAFDDATGSAGHHASFVDTAGQQVFYAVITHPDRGANVTAIGLTGSESFFQMQTQGASHELAEAVTDPQVWQDSSGFHGTGWHDGTSGNALGNEIGDIPQQDLTAGRVQGSITGTLDGYLVQELWSNHANRDVLPTNASWATLSSTARFVTVGLNADGRMEVFMVDNANVLWHAWQMGANGSFSGWSLMRTGVASVAVGTNLDGRMEVFAVNTDHSLCHIWQVAANQYFDASGPDQGWYLMDGSAQSLTVGRNQDGRMELFDVDPSGNLWHRWQMGANSSFSAWSLLRTGVASVAVGMNQDQRMEVFAVNTDHSLCHIWQAAINQYFDASGPDQGWYPLDSSVAAVTVGYNADGRMELFEIDTSNNLRHCFQVQTNSYFSDWSPMLGDVSFVATGQNTNGTMEVYAVGREGGFYRAVQSAPNAYFNEWQYLSGTYQSLAVDRNADGRLEVLALDSSGQLLDSRQTSAGSWLPLLTPVTDVATVTVKDLELMFAPTGSVPGGMTINLAVDAFAPDLLDLSAVPRDSGPDAPDPASWAFRISDLTSAVVNPGAGNIVNVLSTPASLTTTIVGQGGDLINLGGVGDTTAGANTLDSLLGGVTVQGTPTDALRLNDQSTATAQTFTVTATGVTRSGDVAVTYANLQSVTINGGSGGNTVNVQATPAGVPVTITGGAGNDTYTVGSAAQTLDSIRGPLTIDGGAGSSSLTLNDQGNPAVTTWTRTPGRVVQQRLEGPAVGTTEIDYANLPTPVINAGRGLNTLTGSGPLQRTFALGSTGTDHITDAVTTDGQGNFYLTGYFHGTVDFDPSSNVQALTSVGDYNGYVAKYSPTGGLIWVRQLAGNGTDSCDGYGLGVAVDGSGNVYVCGQFSGTATLGGTTLTNPTGYAAFAAKLDPAGTVLWARALALGNDGGDAYRLAPDGAGNVYAIGDFQGTVSFGGTTLTSAGGYEVFVAKLTSTGTVAWAKRLGGGGNDWGYGLALDRSGNVYVSGSFQGTATFGTFSLTTAGSYGAFVARLDGNGTVKWARGLTGSGEVDGYGLALDGSGNVYVAGDFAQTAQFGASTLTSAGGYDAFVAKLSGAGAVQWARRFGGSDGDEGVAPNAVAVDGSGNVYVGGGFEGTATFGTTSFTASGVFDGYLMELDGAGTVAWAKQLAGSELDVWGLAVDGAGTLDAVAYFQGTADLDPGPGVFNVASSNPPSGFVYTADDTFVLQLAQAGPLTFTGLAGVGSASYRLRQSGGDLQIVDDATGQVLLSKALADTTSVTIQAANGVNTTLTIDFSGGAFTIPVTFTGGTGTNTLVGPDAANAWSITGANAGKVGKVSFSKVANVVGGSGVDVFKFTAAGSLSGRLDGGAAPVHQGNWLDYSGLTSAVAVNLQTGSASKVAGGAVGKVANIQDVHGGDGGSTLTGNGQGNILIGGAGADTIQGGSGRSLLIGGKGADHVTGGSGGDILIGDYTSYDAMTTANETALMGILAEWQSAHSYATRFHDINTGTGGGLNGTKKLNFGTTVKDDGAADTVTAAASAQALDWFFQGLGDQLFNLQPGEHVNNT
jgi:hypothetical protein